MQVRMGHAGDFVVILPMMRKHWALHEQWDEPLYALRSDADARFQRWIGPIVEDARSMLVVAEEGGKIVGFLTAMMESDLPIHTCDEHAVIIALWIEPEHRRHGAAKALLEKAASEYATMGVSQLRIRTAVANEAGRAMLEQAGFRVGTIDLLRELEPGAGE